MRVRCNRKGKYDRVGIFGNIWNSLSPYKPDICHKNDKMRLTALLRHMNDLLRLLRNFRVMRDNDKRLPELRSTFH